MKLVLTPLRSFSFSCTAACFVLLTFFVVQCVGQCVKPGLVPIKTTILTGPGPEAVADVNGDGKPDLVTHEDPGKTKISLGLGNGSFAAPVTYTTNEGGLPPAFGDLNGDGKPEMLVLNPPTAILAVWMNNGTGGFSLANSFSLPEYLVTVADLNGDNHGDLVSTPSDTSFNVRFGNGSGGFGAPVTYTPAVAPYSLVNVIPGDFNGDGRMDFATSSTHHTNVVSDNFVLYLTNASGTLVESANYNIGTAELMTAGDLNGDGKADLFGVTQSAFTGTILLNTGGATFTQQDLPLANYPIGPTSGGFATMGDFDGDGKTDIFLDHYFYPQVYRGKTVLFGDGTGGISRKAYISKPTAGALQGDFNNDGKTDFLEVGYNLWTNEALLNVRQPTCSARGETRLIDYDGDGRTEFSIFRPSNGNWYQFGQYAENQTAMTHFGANGDIPTPGDFDGDGKTDLAVFRAGTGDWYVLHSSDQSFAALHFGQTGDRPVPGDFDGDGRADIAVYRPSTGTWYQLYSSDNSFHGINFGLGTDIPVPADFDGDLKADLVVFRPSEGIWYLLNSSSNSFSYQAWGSAGDLPVAADYDGDGRTDIAVFRPSSGSWYALRSYDSALMATQFGTAGDIPIPGFAGGGLSYARAPSVALPAVYRPGTGYIYTAFSGAYRPVGIAGDIPVSGPYPVN
jgi:hypothetical protein